MTNISTLRMGEGALSHLSGMSFMSEVFPGSVADAGAISFVLSSIKRNTAPILWVQDRMSQREAGIPYVPALPNHAIIRVNVSRPIDVLWAMEEGLQFASLCAVIGEVWGDPPILSFTSSKRLAFRSEANGTPCWLIRRAAHPNLSAARNRWRIASLASFPHPDDPQAPGAPRWRAELFRSRTMRIGTWVASYDRAADCLCFDAPFRDGTVEEGQRTQPRFAAR